MNVKELKRALEGVPDEMPVSVNAEGTMIMLKPAKKIVVGEGFVICGW